MHEIQGETTNEKSRGVSLSCLCLVETQSSGFLTECKFTQRVLLG